MMHYQSTATCFSLKEASYAQAAMEDEYQLGNSKTHETKAEQATHDSLRPMQEFWVGLLYIIT
jgi:hypothetical protein